MGIYKVVNRIKMSQSGEENEVPQQEPVEEEKADNIKDAIKSVIKKSQANDGLAKASNVPLIEVEKRDDLGEWLGHCKYDADGAPKKVKGTSSIAITNYGEETEALTFVLNYIKEKGLGN